MEESFALEDFEEIKVLGQGSFGRAILVRWKKDGCLYVLKAINVSSLGDKERRAALAEATVHKSLMHPNIIGCYGSFLEKGCLYIVLEYADGSDLSVAVKTARKKGRFFSEQRVLTWLSQLVSALSYLHSRRILHRDIKASNVYLHGRDKVVRLGDLGIARVLSHESSFVQTFVGTPYYLSPELVSNEQYSYKSDVWSLGCLLYELLSLKHAFDASNMCSLVLRILRGAYDPIDPTRYSPELTRLIDWTLQLNPSERPTMSQLTAYPLIQRTLRECVAAEEKLGRRRLAGAQAAVEDAVREALGTGEASADAAGGGDGEAPADASAPRSRRSSRDKKESDKGGRGALLSAIEEAAANVAAVSASSGAAADAALAEAEGALAEAEGAADEDEALAPASPAGGAQNAAPASTRRSIRVARSSRRSASRPGVVMFRSSAASAGEEEARQDTPAATPAGGSGSSDSCATFPSDAVGLDEEEQEAGGEEAATARTASSSVCEEDGNEHNSDDEDDEEEEEDSEEKWYDPVDPAAAAAAAEGSAASSHARTRRAPHATISHLLHGRAAHRAPPRSSRPGSRRASVVAMEQQVSTAAAGAAPAAAAVPVPPPSAPVAIAAELAVAVEELLVTPDYRPDPEAHLLERFADARKARARSSLDMFKTMPAAQPQESAAADEVPAPAATGAALVADAVVVSAEAGATTPSGVVLLPGMPLKTGPVRKSRKALVTPMSAGGSAGEASASASLVQPTPRADNLSAMLEQVRRLEDVVLSAVGPGVPFGAPPGGSPDTAAAEQQAAGPGPLAAAGAEAGAVSAVGGEAADAPAPVSAAAAATAAPLPPVQQRVPTLSVVRRSIRTRASVGAAGGSAGSDAAASSTPRSTARRRSRIVRTPVLGALPAPASPSPVALGGGGSSSSSGAGFACEAPFSKAADATAASSDGDGPARGFLPLPPPLLPPSTAGEGPPSGLPSRQPSLSNLAAAGAGDRRRRASWTRAHHELMSAAVHLEIAQHMRDMLITEGAPADAGASSESGPSSHSSRDDDEGSAPRSSRHSDLCTGVDDGVHPCPPTPSTPGVAHRHPRRFNDSYSELEAATAAGSETVPVTKPILAVLARIPSFSMGSFSSSSASASLLAAAGSAADGGYPLHQERAAMGPLPVRGTGSSSSGAPSLNTTANSASGLGGGEGGDSGSESGSARRARPLAVPLPPPVQPAVALVDVVGLSVGEADAAADAGVAVRRRSVLRFARRTRAASLGGPDAGNSLSTAVATHLAGGEAQATSSAPGSGTATPTRRRSLRGPRGSVIVTRSRPLSSGGSSVAAGEAGAAGGGPGAPPVRRRRILQEDTTTDSGADTAGSDTSRSGSCAEAGVAFVAPAVAVPAPSAPSAAARVIGGVPPRHRQSRRITRSPAVQRPSPAAAAAPVAAAAASQAAGASPLPPRGARLPPALVTAAAGFRGGMRITHSRRHSTGSAVALLLADAPEGARRATPRLTVELQVAASPRVAAVAAASRASPLSHTFSAASLGPSEAGGGDAEASGASGRRLSRREGGAAALPPPLLLPSGALAALEQLSWKIETLRASCETAIGSAEGFAATYKQLRGEGDAALTPAAGELPPTEPRLPQQPLPLGLARALSSPQLVLPPALAEEAGALPPSMPRQDVLARMQLLLGLEDQLAAGLSKAAAAAAMPHSAGGAGEA